MSKKLFLFVLYSFAIVCVRASVWYVSPTGSGTGASWAEAGNLQQIVQQAVSGDEIWAMSGRYACTLSVNVDLTIRGGFAGTEATPSQRAIQSMSVLDAVGTSTSAISVSSQRFVMDRFMITNGHSSFGGGICMLGGQCLKLSDMQIYDNTADQEGGGVYADDVDTIWIENTIFNSDSSGDRGGGMDLVRSNYIFLMNVLVVENIAANFGGGILFENDSNAFVLNATITQNRSMLGPGVNCDRSNVLFYNTILWANTDTLYNEGQIDLSCRVSPSNVSYQHCYTWENGVLFLDGPLTSTYTLSCSIQNVCVNAGVWLSSFPAAALDIAHQPRVCGGRVDIGAYECQGM